MLGANKLLLPIWAAVLEERSCLNFLYETLNPFSSKSDQISPAASSEILHHAIWRTWPFIAPLIWKWIILPIHIPQLIRFSLEVGRMYFLNLGVKGLKHETLWVVRCRGNERPLSSFALSFFLSVLLSGFPFLSLSLVLSFGFSLLCLAGVAVFFFLGATFSGDNSVSSSSS